MDSIISDVKTSIKLVRTCIICEEQTAKYSVKGILKNCYCEDCAKDQFADLKLLQKL